MNQYNLQYLKTFIINGPEKHPGANFVELTNGNKIFLHFTNREKVAEELKIGDVVERHLINNDIILFNRQPSLHRQSIMAFRAKVLPSRSLRFNECNCSPFNADFDGDEMNIHLPQTEEARAEALLLMGVKENLITAKNSEPLIAAVQDFLTSFYIITQKDCFLNRTQFFKFLGYFNDCNEKIEIPTPAILKPMELWTGKQLFSVLLRPNRRINIIVNIELKARNFSKKLKRNEFLCVNDGYVVIQDSTLLAGNLCKNSLGNGSKTGIVFTLIKDNNQHITADFLCRLSKFSSRFIGDYGVSLGIGDVFPDENLNKKKTELVNDCYKNCESQIELFKSGQISLKAGMNAEESLESIMIKTLSDVRETIGSYLRSSLPKTNAALIMAICGSKGSDINLSQMIACVGQQIVSGQRIADGFHKRTLPHFEKNSKYPASKGFVENSFFTGLNATEFFFHTVCGREGLVDTAVKTAETGYMQRRLMKALEDLTVQYNYSVTNSVGDIIQFVYGDDMVDPMNVDEGKKIINLDRLLNYVKSVIKTKNEDCLSKKTILLCVNQELSLQEQLKKISEGFLNEVRDFFHEYVNKIDLVYNELLPKIKTSLNSFEESLYQEIHEWNSFNYTIAA